MITKNTSDYEMLFAGVDKRGDVVTAVIRLDLSIIYYYPILLSALPKPIVFRLNTLNRRALRVKKED